MDHIREELAITLEVIGAGFGRTGTMTLKVALEELGFGPCYHMIELFEHPEHVAQFYCLLFENGADHPPRDHLAPV